MTQANDGEPSAGRVDGPAVPDSMRTQMWPVASVHRYPSNPRTKQNVAKMAGLLTRYGWKFPIVVDSSGVIVAGDTRYLAALHLSMTHVPVWVASDLTPAEITAFRIADNRIAEESDWDRDALAGELALLQQMGFQSRDELQSVTAFDRGELEGYLATAAKEAHELSTLDVRPLPQTTWVMIGIDTARFFEISTYIDRIGLIPGVFCDVATSNEKP